MFNDLEAKTIYELSKLTASSKIIMDDFLSTALITIFKDYIKSYDNPELALNSFMNYWEQNIVMQKEVELDTLSTQSDSLSNMAIGNTIASSEDIDNFILEVSDIKEMITESVMDSIGIGDKDDED